MKGCLLYVINCDNSKLCVTSKHRAPQDRTNADQQQAHMPDSTSQSNDRCATHNNERTFHSTTFTNSNAFYTAAAGVDLSTSAAVSIIKQAVAKPNSVPAPAVLDAMLQLEAAKLPVSTA
jgi:hypothetical protein